MGLDKSIMADGFEPIFNPDSEPQPESESECAQLLTDIIIEYLGAVELAAPTAPGIGPIPAAPSPVPGPDPAFSATQKPTPVVPVDANASTIQSGLEGAMMTNRNTPTKSGWAQADSAFISYVGASFSAWQEVGGYMFTGATAPGTIALEPVMSEESSDPADIAAKLADHIHTFFTTCIFTGAYQKPPPPPVGPFVGPAPHVSPLE